MIAEAEASPTERDFRDQWPWHVNPYILGIPVYPITFAGGLLVAAAFVIRNSPKLGISTRQASWIVAVAAAMMLTGGKIHSLLERGEPTDPLSWELVYGYRYGGGVVAFLLALVAVSRQPGIRASFLALADLFAPALTLAIAIIRGGCFLSGCCFGRVCSLSWAVAFPEHSKAWWAHQKAGLLEPGAAVSLPVHPLQLYFAVWGLIMAGLLVCLGNKKRYDGQLFFWYLTLHGIGKFALEFYRHDYQVAVHVMSLGMGVAGLILLANGSRWSSGGRAENEATVADAPYNPR